MLGNGSQSARIACSDKTFYVAFGGGKTQHGCGNGFPVVQKEVSSCNFFHNGGWRSSLRMRQLSLSSKERKQRREQRAIEEVRRSCPGLIPQGEDISYDRPDCLIKQSEIMGIEVTWIPESIKDGLLSPPPKGSPPSAWKVRDDTAHDVLPLRYEVIEKVIIRKNQQLSIYRERIKEKSIELLNYAAPANGIWLLIVNDWSSCLEVPRDIGMWKFSFEFDRVLLLAPDDAVGVYDLARRFVPTERNFR